MTKQARRWVTVVTIAAFAHMGCYNTYFISKDELEKLESGVEVKEVVKINADCKGAGSVAQEGVEKGPTVAEAEQADKSKKDDKGETASDAVPASAEKSKGEANKKKGNAAPAGCKEVPVSTANAVNVVTKTGEQRRVTPFNFMMSERQIVAPEYDLLMNLDRVKGAKVREFSTWKTVGMISGVTAATVGSFIYLSVTSDEAEF